MRVFRLSKRKYSSKLDGKGAAKYGNRWNSKGVEILYTAGSRALALVEVAVHLPLATLPKDFMMMTVEIPPPVSIETLDLGQLPEGWSSIPTATQQIGDQFIESERACVLKVPSAVVPGDFNYLINPDHAEFTQVEIVEVVDFHFDKRLFS